MKNKLYLSLLGLLVLAACSDKNNNVSDVDHQDGKKITSSSQKKQELTQEKLYLKIQLKQKENAEQIQNYLEDLKKEINSEEKAKEAQKEAKAKFNSLSAELKNYYDSLNITDSDVKEYLKLQEDTLALQKEIETESEHLQQLSKNGTQKLTQAQTKKYSELNQKLAQVSQSILAKKVAIDEKFASSSSGIVKEYYQVANVMNLEAKNAESIANRLSNDKSIKSGEIFNQRFLAEVQKIDEKIIQKLDQLEINDVDVKEYKNQLVNMIQKKIVFSNKFPDIQKEYAKNKKLSGTNEAMYEELNKLNKLVSEQLSKVLNKVTQ